MTERGCLTRSNVGKRRRVPGGAERLEQGDVAAAGTAARRRRRSAGVAPAATWENGGGFLAVRDVSNRATLLRLGQPRAARVNALPRETEDRRPELQSSEFQRLEANGDATTRNPKLPRRASGSRPRRHAQRTPIEPTANAPPRTTRAPPSPSRDHCQTFPLRSSAPHGLIPPGKQPAALVALRPGSEQFARFASNASPHGYLRLGFGLRWPGSAAGSERPATSLRMQACAGSCRPPRAAFSHSASEGNVI